MKIKTILAGIIAAGMCFACVGCADSSSDIEKDIEDKFNSIAEQIDKEENGKVDSKTADSEVNYEASDEIKKADFASGLVQIGNEIFKNGGYMTVDQVVEKYSDKFDTSGILPDSNVSKNQSFFLYMTAKDDPSLKVTGTCLANLNATTDKLRQGDCAAVLFTANKNEASWYPTGIRKSGEGYDINSLVSMLEGLGYKKLTKSEVENKYYKNYGMFWENSTKKAVHYVLRESGAEKNLYGYHPLIEYQFSFNLEDSKARDISVTIRPSHYFKAGDLDEFTRIS